MQSGFHLFVFRIVHGSRRSSRRVADSNDFDLEFPILQILPRDTTCIEYRTQTNCTTQGMAISTGVDISNPETIIVNWLTAVQ
jgi:hypothetical protein